MAKSQKAILEAAKYAPKSAEEKLVMEWRRDPLLFVTDQFGIEPSEQQKQILKAVGKKGARCAVSSGHGIGKVQTIRTIVPTPRGMRRWGDLKVGDYLFGVDGRPVKIVDIPFRGMVDILRVTFDDDSFMDTSYGHLWTVQGRNTRRTGRVGYETLSTKEIMERGVKRKNGIAMARQWGLPFHGAVRFGKKKLPVPAYLIGAWLGNGHAGSTAMTINGEDEDVMSHIKELNSESSRRVCEGKNCYSVGLHGVLSGFKELKILHCTSEKKFIPERYKTSSIEDRWELLRGLMDTDGECDSRGVAQYSSTSKQLAEDIMFVARSLGGKAQLQPTTKKPFYYDKERNKVPGRDCYRVTLSFPPGVTLFHSQRKQCNLLLEKEPRYYTRWIDSIEPMGYQEEGMCVTVDSPDGLYLANDFIVTHNSASLAWTVLWALTCFNDVKIGCTAPTATQMQDVLLKEVEKWRDKMLSPWRESIMVTKDKVYLEGGTGFATMRTGRKENPEALQGLHADTMIFLIDEASGIDEKVYEVARGALSTPAARIVMTSNPTRSTGYFYNAFHRARDNWDLFRFSCLDSPFVSEQYVKEMKEEYGEESDIYRVRVLGEFPSGGDLQFIPTTVVEEAAKRYYDESAYNFAPLVLGVDVAYFGGDRSVIYLRQGLHARKLFSVQGIEIADFAGHVARFWDEYNADAVFVDSTGVGAGVVSNLRLMGRQPIPVAFAGKSGTEGYHNKRAECWGLMKAWLQDGGWIPDDTRLKDDLTGPEYSYTISGQVILERKADMKKRGLHSPDEGDSLAICWSEPVLAKKKRGPMGNIAADYGPQKKKYDPFHVFKKKRRR